MRQTILWITGWAMPAGQLRSSAAEALPDFCKDWAAYRAIIPAMRRQQKELDYCLAPGA